MNIKSIASKGLELFASKPAPVVQIAHNAELVPTWEANKAARNVFNYASFGEEGYRKNVVIFACIVARTTSYLQPALELKRKKKGGGSDVVTDHQLLDLLADPIQNPANPEKSGREADQLSWNHYEVTGNSYQLITNSGAGLPARLDQLPPDKISPIRESDGTVERYEYDLGGGAAKKYFEAVEILHLKNQPDYNNPWIGISGMAVAIRQGDLSNQIADFMLALMLNSGVPGMILRNNSQDVMTAEQKEDLREQFTQRYAGRKAGNALFLGSSWEVLGSGQTPKAMDMGTFLTYSEQMICSAFRVPPVIVGVMAGLENLTYNNFETAKRLFWQDQLMPDLLKRAEKMSKLCAPFGEEYFLEYNFSKIDALRRRVTEEDKHNLELFKVNAINRNQLLVASGFPEIEGEKNVYYNQLAVPPATKPDDDDNEEEEAADIKEKDGLIKVLMKPKYFNGKTHTVTVPKEQHAISNKQWRVIHAIADAAEPKMRRTILKIIAETQGAVVASKVEAALRRGDIEAAMDTIPWAEMRNHLKATLETQIWNTAVKAAQASEVALPFNYSFDVANPKSITWARDYSAQLVTGIEETTRTAIREIIERGFSEGITPRDMAKEIKELVGLTPQQASGLDTYRKERIAAGDKPADLLRKVERRRQRYLKQRAEMISRTETINASNRGQEELWRQAEAEGLIDKNRTKRIWITTDDDRTDSQCLVLDGTKAELDGLFPGGIEGPTLHPRCRCATGLVFE